MTKTQQLISIPFSALFLSIFSRLESTQSSWSRNSAQPFRFVCLLTFYYELLIIHKAFLTQLSFYIVPRIYPFFLKKIKINKIKSIGKISGKKQHCTMKNHNHQEVGGLLGETSQESSVKQLQIVGRRCKSSDLIRSGQIWSRTTTNGLQREV